MKKYISFGVFAILVVGTIVASCKKEEKVDCNAAATEWTNLSGQAASIKTKADCTKLYDDMATLLNKYSDCYAGQKASYESMISQGKTTCDMLP